MTVKKLRLAEEVRLQEDSGRTANWKRWGPYLAERQWGTVREDYSEDGRAWDYFPHDHARSRVYRWGEDGLLGITDRQGRLCFALALWNGTDAILKERLFGLGGNEGNHGEDVKESYFYLDSTPTHSYMKALYKYPQRAFPYEQLVQQNRARGRREPEFELHDTGIFDDDRYFDVLAEYAKVASDSILIRITISNRGPDPARIDVLPTLWFRNTWSWGRTGEGYWHKPSIRLTPYKLLLAEHSSLGAYRLAADAGPGGQPPEFLFTENESNLQKLYGTRNVAAHCKDAFDDYIVHGRKEALATERSGTKAAAHYRLHLPPRASAELRLHLFADSAGVKPSFGTPFDRTFAQRIEEADEFYAARVAAGMSAEEKQVLRQGYAGLLWTKQFYHYSVKDWIEGDPSQPPPPEGRAKGRNYDWLHLYNRDVISLPDKWEYPWYAAWDLAFHMIPYARIDPDFAKEQLLLFLREWYMHPNGQIPAYEWAFSDVNPPVHAWAAWRVYKMTAPRGTRDVAFLARVFQKLMLNFTWWVNRKDFTGRHIFSGGFLGLDNIGVFDRSRPLPTGGYLEQADGTAWMAFFCGTMLSMALELASNDPVYEDVASKFFEHFVAIIDAMNAFEGRGLWNEEDGFYYDHLHVDGKSLPLKVRSMVGLIPLFTIEVLEQSVVDKLPGFKKRMLWFLENNRELARHVSGEIVPHGDSEEQHFLLAVPSRERLERVLRYMLDEKEFLSPYGIRSLSRVHGEQPYVFRVDGTELPVRYTPGESTTALFGGNSNWRGPIWFPVNYLLVEMLERFHHFYGDELRVECPTGSGVRMNLSEVAQEIKRRLVSIFLPGAEGHRPCHGGEARFAHDPSWQDLVLFHEYFHGDTGKGLGASHQTGWTALVLRCIEDLARAR
ncbi:MAG: glucosidase [Planctomycetes bacterium]|nr:glucosidase [Planctomycetota bacterium]